MLTRLNSFRSGYNITLGSAGSTGVVQITSKKRLGCIYGQVVALRRKYNQQVRHINAFNKIEPLLTLAWG